tara:strand:+ start:757 stop:1557 length:801 start_codon:yes stop_codon:yes gene_type:complete
MATIDISALENLEMDSARSREETEALIQFLRQRQKRATQEDVAFAKSLKSVGQAGIKGLKTRRDFLLARRGDPSITLKDFLLSPEKSAVAMKSGVERIVAEKAPSISLKETLGLDKERGFQLLKPEEEILPGDARLSADTRSMNILGKLDANKATTEEIAEAVSQAKERLGDVKETVELAGDIKDITISDSADVLTDASTGASSLTSSALTSLGVAKDISSISRKGLTPQNLLSILGTGISFLNPIAGLVTKGVGTILGMANKVNR